jgi:hypothetical protein
MPLDPKKLMLDVAIDEWAPKVKEMLPSLRGKLL